MNAMIKSYLRALAVTTLVAMLSLGKTPIEFNANDWLTVANAIWVSFIPVVIRALDVKDAAFGRKQD
jgi:hypothetical protein